MSNSTDTRVAPILRPGLEAMELTRKFTLGLLEPIGGDQMVTRACKNANHTAYVIGHIAATDDYFLKELAGQASALPESWEGKFGMGVELSDDAAAYPSKQELVDAMAERRGALVAWLCALSEAELLAPIEGDLAQFATSRAALPGALAFHEGFHAGQMSTTRRALGIELMF